MAKEYIAYALPPYVPHDLSGLPIPDGKVFFFEDEQFTTKKNVYQNPDGTNPYDNPIVLDSGGRVNTPIYFEYDVNVPDERYWVVVASADSTWTSVGGIVGTVITQYEYPYIGVTEQDPNVGDPYENHIKNGQFRKWKRQSIDVGNGETVIADSGWSFIKNNASSTNTVTFETFSPGQTDVPNNPRYYFKYECTGAGAGESENDLVDKFLDVEAFSGEQIVIQLRGKSAQNSIVELFWQQHFGLGGSPTVTTPIATVNLTTQWDLYHNILAVPSITGKSVKDGNYARLIIRMPLNSTSDAEFTNSAINTGNVLYNYSYLTNKEEEVQAYVYDYTNNPVYVPNFKNGMNLKYNSGTLFDVLAGKTSDSTNTVVIRNTVATFTKDSSAAWAVGAGNGALGDGVSVPANGWLHVFALKKPLDVNRPYLFFEGEEFDVGLDTDVNGSNVLTAAAPDGFTAIKRIGSLQFDSSVIVEKQYAGDYVINSTNSAVSSGVPASSPGTTHVLPVPPDVLIKAQCWVEISDAASDQPWGVYLSSSLEPVGRTIARVQPFGSKTPADGSTSTVITNNGEAILSRSGTQGGSSTCLFHCVRYREFFNN